MPSLRGIDRRVLIVSTGVLLFVAARLSTITFLGIYFVRDQGFPAALVGIGFLLENVVRAVLAPLAGTLSDRFGRRPLLLPSAAATALLMPTFLLVRDPVGLLVWSVAVGVAQAPFFAVGTALLIDLAPRDRRQSVLALNYTALSIGYTLGIAPAGFIAERGFALLAAWSALGFIAVLALYALALGGPLPHEEGAAARPGSVLTRSVQPFRDTTFLALVALVILLPLGLGAVALVLPLYAADSGVPERTIGLLLSANGILVALLALPVNAYIERRGAFRYLPLACGLTACTFAALAVSGGPLGILTGVVVFSLAEVIFSSALPTAVAAISPAGSRGSYQGAWSMAFSLALGSALFFGGLGRDTVGWPTTWTALAAATVLAGIALVVTRGRFEAAVGARGRAAA